MSKGKSRNQNKLSRVL